MMVRMEDRAVEMRRAVVRKDFPLLVEVRKTLQQDRSHLLGPVKDTPLSSKITKDTCYRVSFLTVTPIKVQSVG